MGGALEGEQAASDRVGSRQGWQQTGKIRMPICQRIEGSINGSSYRDLPYVSCGKQIELNRLQQLEQSIIRRFPNVLNKCRHPASPHRVLQSSVDLDKHAKNTSRKADRKGYDDSRVDTAVTYEGSAMKSGLGTSPKSFFIMSPCYQVQHGGYN